MGEMRFGKAINQAISEAMEADVSVVLFGEDIAEAGGPFGVTKGLLERFGNERVRDTPISEASITSAGVGAALTGLKPIVEIMFMDFTTLAMDGLVNQAAKAHFMFGGQASVPLVVRMPHGGGLNAGPQHSQCLEAWFAHVPGLKVVCPASSADAYGLMLSAIEDRGPVIFVENKALYARKDTVPESLERVPLGKARVAREGSDVTVVTYGGAVAVAEEAASQLASEGLETEIIDLRTIQIWDEATVLTSLTKTHRLVVLHEAVEAFGVGAEIAARMADVGFDELDGPIVRVGAPFMPVPFSKNLEDSFIPNTEQVVSAIRKVMR